MREPLTADQLRLTAEWVNRTSLPMPTADERVMAILRPNQVAVYVMCGGGRLGHSACTDPRSFYIDDRVGRLPYSRRQIMKAVHTLAQIASTLGFERDLPPLPGTFHNLHVF